MSYILRAAFLLPAALVASSGLLAQNPELPPAHLTPKNIIKIAPLGWVHGQMPFSVESRVGYERVVSRQGSVAGSYSYLGTNYPFNFIGSFALSAAISSAFTLAGHPSVYWTDVRIRTQGYRYQLQYRHYLSATKPAPEGFYLAPHFSYTKADYDIRLKDFDTQVTINTTNRNYNLLLGFQHILGRHFVIDAFTGLGYRDKTTKSFDQNGKLLEALPKGTRLKLSSGLNLGWGF